MPLWRPAIYLLANIGKRWLNCTRVINRASPPSGVGSRLGKGPRMHLGVFQWQEAGVGNQRIHRYLAGAYEIQRDAPIFRAGAGGYGTRRTGISRLFYRHYDCSRHAIRQSDSLQGTTFSLLLTCRNRNGQRLRGIVPHRRFLNVDSPHRWGTTVGLL